MIYIKISTNILGACPISCMKQNRSTEGCSKLKRYVDMTRSEKMVSTSEQMQVPKWDRTRSLNFGIVAASKVKNRFWFWERIT